MPIEAQIAAIDVAEVVERLVQRVQSGRLMIEADVAKRDVPDLRRFVGGRGDLRQ